MHQVNQERILQLSQRKVTVEQLLDLLNSEDSVLDEMAEAAAKKVYIQAQKLRSKPTVTPSQARDILETEIQQLSANEGSNVGTRKDLVLSLNQAPDERVNENLLFNKISFGGGQVDLPSPIVIKRHKYLRPARVHGKDGWFSDVQQLSEPGYLQDLGGGEHTVNYVMARLGGFSSLQQGSKRGSSMVSYFEGRDILLSSIFRALESIMKSNKKILYKFFDQNAPPEDEEMEPKEVYCIIDGMKRLKEKGVAPSEAHKIAKKVYEIVKQSCQTTQKK